MKRLHIRTGGAAACGLLVVLGLSSTTPEPCSNDAGIGNLDEGENCLADHDVDRVNGGCNLSPALFVTLSVGDFIDGVVDICGSASTYKVDGACDVDADCPDNNCVGDPNPGDGTAEGTCVGPSEPSVGRRDTDWYLIPQSVLTAHDFDQNGIVHLSSEYLGAELDLTTRWIGITDPAGSCGAVFIGDPGCWDVDDNANNNTAAVTVPIADHPDGVVVFAAPGLCWGFGIFDGFECSTGNNDYILRVTFIPPPSSCAPGSGPCHVPNGTPGCDSPDCCAEICAVIPQCCEIEWDGLCADRALEFCSLCDCTLDSECGAGRACVDGTCALVPTGACCQCDGANQFCEEMTAADCLTAGGTYLGDGMGCESGRIIVESCADAIIYSTPDTISVEESFEIRDVAVQLVIAHTWIGELCVTLQKDDGPSALLIERMMFDGGCDPSCCGCSSDHLNITLRDEVAGGHIDRQCGWFPPALTGVFVPQEPLSAFEGLDSAGDWTLTVSDHAGSGDIGHLRRWGLHLTGPAHDPPPCSEISCACPCDCEAPPDGIVDIVDFLALLVQWGGPGTCDCADPPDGVVNVNDFLAMLTRWGPCP
ncbi:MAG: hypothetical protein ACYS0D_02735 [Planctomycetota bacterium]|jgi:hypothetical protein